LALAGAAWIALGIPAAYAQTVSGQTAPAPKPEAKPAAAEAADDSDNEVSELVVTASSPTVYATQRGSALGGLAPELQLGPLDIQSYGVSNVSQLLDELAIQTNSSRGRGGETPVVLLNGKRISGLGEVRDIPTEAILRVDILPEETALSYGFTADQKVVNFVLRPRFRSLTNEINGGGPTAGGQVNGSLEADQFRVRGDNRLNIDIKLNGNTDLKASDRGLDAQASGPPYALAGNIVGTGANGEIDPALSRLVGHPVTLAGVPPVAATRAPTLQDFAATANAANTDKLGNVRDLSSANQNISANMVAARAFGDQTSATLNASFNSGASQSLQGLPGLLLLVPGGNPFSPFATGARLYRYVDAVGPLKQDTSNWSGHLGLTVNKQMDKWRFSLTGAYDHADTLIETSSGISAVPLQALLNANSATFNPFGPLPASLLTRQPNSEARSISDSANLQALVNGPLLKVPAGTMNGSFKLGDSQSGFVSSSQRLGLIQRADLSRNDLNGQINLDLPLTSRRNHVLAPMGELSVNVNLAVDRLSDFGTIHSVGYGLNWQPITQVRLVVSRTRDEAAPSVSQLGAPTLTTPGVRIFDYATGQTVDVTAITGSNPALIGDTRNVFKVGLTLKPWSSQQFTLNANYVDQRIDNPISTFPAATPAIEAAFPERFVRDVSGDLIAVDQRPTNFDWTSRRNIRFGFNWSMPVGKPVQRPQRPLAAPPGDGQPPPQGRGQQGQGQQARGPDGQGGPGPGFRGGGGGPGGGGGFRGGGGGGAGQGRFELAVFDTMYFTNETLVRPSGPLLDVLAGAPTGKTGGQPVNAIDGQMGYTKSGLGARINATWTEGTTVIGGGTSPSSILTFSDLTTIHLRLFANFGQMPQIARKHPFLRGARLTIGLYNVFDQRLRVHDATGVTPLSYQPAYLDPTGRTFSVSFRKLLF
jgi:uncharacterized membrane protein YgcG